MELLVAIALGAFITIGIIQMFTANQETYQVNIGQARMQESARFAMEFITTPMRMAGFMGCYSEPEGWVTNLAADPTADYLTDFSAFIDGHEATAPGVWAPPLNQLPADIDTANIQPGTDVLTIRTTDPGGTRVAATAGNNLNPLPVRQLDATENPNYQTGAVVVASDCQKATFFRVTGFTTPSGDVMELAHVQGGAFTPSNTQQQLTQDGTIYDTDATVHRLETQIFYIAPGLGQNNRGNAPLSLWRKFAFDAPQELVEGIQDLQVDAGLDTDNDGVPNIYQTLQLINAADMDQILTIRVSVTANSVDVVNDVGDGLITRTFTNTIALRNRL